MARRTSNTRRVRLSALGLSLVLAAPLVVLGAASDARAAPSQQKARAKASGPSRTRAKPRAAPAKKEATPPAAPPPAAPPPAAPRPAAPLPANAGPSTEATVVAPEARAEAAPPGSALVETVADSAGEKTYTFGAQEVEGRLASPQILYFLRRVRAQFDPAPLGHRSFLLELSDTRRHPAFE
jgi:hypothetical protein